MTKRIVYTTERDKNLFCWKHQFESKQYNQYCLTCTSVKQLWRLSAYFSLFSIVTNWCFQIKWRHINLLLCKIFSLFLAFRRVIYPALIWFTDITLSSNSHSHIQIKYIINQASFFRTEFKWKFSCLSACNRGILSTVYWLWVTHWSHFSKRSNHISCIH